MAGVVELAQIGRCRLEASVLLEAGREVIGDRRLLLLVCLDLGLAARQQGARLQEEELRADRHEVGQRAQVEAVAGAQRRQVLVRDLNEGDGRDVEVLRLDEVEEEVERPLEDRRVDDVHRHGPTPLTSPPSPSIRS